jgi:hypothetical protein
MNIAPFGGMVFDGSEILRWRKLVDHSRFDHR